MTILSKTYNSISRASTGGGALSAAAVSAMIKEGVGKTLLQTFTITQSVAAIDFPTFFKDNPDYDGYRIEYEDVRASTTNWGWYMQYYVNNQLITSTEYHYAEVLPAGSTSGSSSSSSTVSGINLGSNLGSEEKKGWFEIQRSVSGNTYGNFQTIMQDYTPGTSRPLLFGVGGLKQTAIPDNDVNAVTGFLLDGFTNLTQGTFHLYGLKRPTPLNV